MSNKNETSEHDESAELHAHMQHMADEQFRRQMRQAAILLSQGHGAEAIPLLERCLELRPDDPNVLSNLGSAYILAGKPKHAVPFLERATEIEPENPSLWANLAAAYLGKLVTSTRAKQDRALEAYRRALELDAAYPNAHYNMGLIYIDRKDWDAAHEAFTRALETNPHDEDARRMQARVAELRDRPTDTDAN